MQAQMRKSFQVAFLRTAKNLQKGGMHTLRRPNVLIARVATPSYTRLHSLWTSLDGTVSSQFRREISQQQPHKMLRACFSSLPNHLVVGLPALSPTMETGTIAEWKKKAGDRFVPGDVICSVETDKATVDFEAQEEGFIAKILVDAKAGEVKVGDPIMVTVDDATSVNAFANFTTSSSAAKAAPAPAPAAAPKAAAAVPPPSAQPVQAQSSGTGGRVFISPLAKKLATEKGLDVSAIPGTGPNGRVIAADVREVSRSAQVQAQPQAKVQAQGQPQSQAAAQPAPQRPVSISGVYEDFVLDDVAQQLAARLTTAKQTVPHYHLSVDLNLDNLLQVRQKLNKGVAAEDQISVQDLLVKAAAVAMRQVPDVNSAWMDSFVRRYDQVDVNLSVGVGGNANIPVLRDVGSLGLKQLAQQRRRLETAAFENTLDAESVKLGTFSVVNLGMYGVKSAATVVLTPQACALALGAAEVRVVPRENPGEGEEVYQFSTMMTVTLACDHRVVDGAVGAQWMSAYKILVEDPISMLM